MSPVKPWKKPAPQPVEALTAEAPASEPMDLELPPAGNLTVPHQFEGRELEAPQAPRDPRRALPIVVEGEIPKFIYRLYILGELWASVEWSESRGRWCVEDACSQCLAHIEGICGAAPNATMAILLAKQMIRDGRMPTPEVVRARMGES
jgi:hypothetical protein